MKKWIMLLVAAAVAAGSAPAQDWAKARLDKSPRHGEWVKVKQGSRDIEAFVTYPEVKDKATAVVVVHDIYGMGDWARGITDQLAEAGYIAIVPDLLSGMGPNKGGTASLSNNVGRAIRDLSVDQKTADLNAMVDYVSKLPSCNGKVVVMGFCWGGAEVFRYATVNKDIKAVLSFYGDVQTDDAAIARINCPIYGFYGGNDARITATVPGATERMKKDGKAYEPVTYEGAGHGFMKSGEDPNGREPDKKAREEGWKRVKEILKKI